MKRPLAIFTIGAATLFIGAAPALAHVEFQPPTATAGATAELNLFVEDESSTAGTEKVELQFPSALTVKAASAPTGWKVSAVEGTIGAPASGLVWEGPANPDSVNVKLTLGDLPATPGPLQFKVIQTYDDGRVDRWIGDADGDNPGPTLQILAVGATTTTGEDSHGGPDHHGAETTIADDHHAGEAPGGDHHSAETTAAPSPTTTAPTDSSDDSSNTGAIVGIIAAVVVLGGGLLVAAKARAKNGDSATK